MKILTDKLHLLPDSTPAQEPHKSYSDIGLPSNADVDLLRCVLMSTLQASSTSECDRLSVGAWTLSGSATKLVGLASADMSSYAAGRDVMGGTGGRAMHAMAYAQPVGEYTPNFISNLTYRTYAFNVLQGLHSRLPGMAANCQC